MKSSILPANYFLLPSASDWRLALRIVLIVFTILIAAALLGSFVSYEQVVRQGHPWLPSYHCPGCIFCGMTRSFCALSSGHWREAWGWNRGGPFLYLGAWLWLTTAAFRWFRGTREKELISPGSSGKVSGI